MKMEEPIIHAKGFTHKAYPEETPEQIRKLKRLTYSLLAGIVFIIVSASILTITNQGKKQAQINNIEQASISPITPKQVSEENQLSSWKSYTDQNFRYTFKYPESQLLETNKNIVSIYGPDSVVISFELSKTNEEDVVGWWKKNAYSFSGAPLSCYSQIVTNTVLDPQNPSEKLLDFDDNILIIEIVSTDEKCLGPFGNSLILSEHNNNLYKIIWNKSILSKQILSSFKFLVTQEEALDKVSNLQEVQDYLQNVPEGKIGTDQKTPEKGKWTIHVYEINKDGLSATHNWFFVDQETGAISKEFDF